jgi:hypothetical protein
VVPPLITTEPLLGAPSSAGPPEPKTFLLSMVCQDLSNVPRLLHLHLTAQRFSRWDSLSQQAEPSQAILRMLCHPAHLSTWSTSCLARAKKTCLLEQAAASAGTSLALPSLDWGGHNTLCSFPATDFLHCHLLSSVLVYPHANCVPKGMDGVPPVSSSNFEVTDKVFRFKM